MPVLTYGSISQIETDEGEIDTDKGSCRSRMCIVDRESSAWLFKYVMFAEVSIASHEKSL